LLASGRVAPPLAPCLGVKHFSQLLSNNGKKGTYILTISKNDTRMICVNNIKHVKKRKSIKLNESLHQ
jgi:hypothetical protein